MKITIPISSCISRLHFLDTCLTSLIFNSKEQHDIIVVTETFDSFNAYREKWINYPNIRFIPSIPKIPSAIPVYQFYNDGIRQAKEEWVMLCCGDDSYFPPGWERLLDFVDVNERKNCYVPLYILAGRLPGEIPEEERRHWTDYGRQYQDTCWSERRLYVNHSFVKESELIDIINKIKGSGCITERFTERRKAFWAHMIIDKSFFDEAGGFGEDPPYPAARDLDLNDVLEDKGAKKVSVEESVIVNCKMPLILSI